MNVCFRVSVITTPCEEQDTWFSISTHISSGQKYTTERASMKREESQ